MNAVGTSPEYHIFQFTFASVLALRLLLFLLSDVDRGGILKLLRHNLDLNTRKASSLLPANSVNTVPPYSVIEEAYSTATYANAIPETAIKTTRVVELDFFWDTFPVDLRAELAACDTILAADVVYDPQITARFFVTLRSVLSLGPKTAWVAVERRERAAEGGGLAAPNFELFKSGLAALQGARLGSLWVRLENVDPGGVKQYFLYSRVGQLTLWKIVSSYDSLTEASSL